MFWLKDWFQVYKQYWYEDKLDAKFDDRPQSYSIKYDEVHEDDGMSGGFATVREEVENQ